MSTATEASPARVAEFYATGGADQHPPRMVEPAPRGPQLTAEQRKRRDKDETVRIARAQHQRADPSALMQWVPPELSARFCAASERRGSIAQRLAVVRQRGGPQRVLEGVAILEQEIATLVRNMEEAGGKFIGNNRGGGWAWRDMYADIKTAGVVDKAVNRHRKLDPDTAVQALKNWSKELAELRPFATDAAKFDELERDLEAARAEQDAAHMAMENW